MPKTCVHELSYSNFMRQDSKIVHNLGEFPQWQVVHTYNFVALEPIYFLDHDFHLGELNDLGYPLLVGSDKAINMSLDKPRL